MGCRQKQSTQLLRNILLGGERVILYSFLLLAGWNMTVMPGAWAPILEHELEASMLRMIELDHDRNLGSP